MFVTKKGHSLISIRAKLGEEYSDSDPLFKPPTTNPQTQLSLIAITLIEWYHLSSTVSGTFFT